MLASNIPGIEFGDESHVGLASLLSIWSAVGLFAMSDPDRADRGAIGSADSVLVGARVLRRSRRSDSTAATLWDDRGLGRSSEGGARRHCSSIRIKKLTHRYRYHTPLSLTTKRECLGTGSCHTREPDQPPQRAGTRAPEKMQDPHSSTPRRVP